MAKRDSVLQTNQIALQAITEAELNTSVAGNGIAGGGGTALAVNPDITSTTTTEANALIVGGNGVSIKLDDDTLEGSLQGSAGAETLRVKADGIGANEVNEGDNYNFTAQFRVATAPTVGTDVVNKTYADAIANGLTWKDPVRLASDADTNWTTAVTADFTTGTLTLAVLPTGSSRGLIDGVEPVDGDRILIKDAGSALSGTGADDKYNGIWEVTGGTTTTLTLTRTTDADVDAEVVSGMAMFVNEGTVNENCGHVLTTDDPIVVDTTALAFTKFTGLGQITAGNGLTKTGDIMSALADILSTTTTEANAINVLANGLGIKVDDSTLEGSGQGSAGAESLRIKDLGVTNAKLANDTILEAKLDATNAPTDGYFLTFDNASGGFTWVESPATSGIQEADIQYDDFTASLNGATTDFVLTDLAIVKSIQVFINGNIQRQGVAYLLNPDSGDTKNIRITGDALTSAERLEVYYVIDN